MKNFLKRINFPALKALVLMAGILGFYQSYGQEFLLRDATFTWDENEEKGYYYWKEFCGAPQGNWTSPYNYKDGTFQFRIQILSKPTTNADRFNMCIWTDFNSSAVTWRESCYSLSPEVKGTGVYTWTGTQSPVVGGGIDWSAVTTSRLWHFGLAHFVGTCNMAPDGYTKCPGIWDDHDLYLPMQMRVSIVGVAKGHSFSGWTYWLNSGGCDDDGGDGDDDPVTPPTPTYKINYSSERTDKVVPSTDEFSYSSNMSGAISGSGAYLYLEPGKNVYFRTKAVSPNPASAIQTLTVPSRPSAPSFAYSFSTEKTTASVSSDYEYSTQSNMSSAVTGTGTTVSVIPGTTMYFRKKATSSAFASSIQTLVIPARPSAPTFGIDYNNETTNATVGTDHQYSDNSDMSSAATGTGVKLSLTPGTSKYFRKKSTASAFASAIQTLAVPARPAAPAFGIDYANETTDQVVSSAYQYSANSDMSLASTGSGNKLAVAPGTTWYFRQLATSSSFLSPVQSLTGPARPSAPSFAIDYALEKTNATVTEDYEYSSQADMSAAMTGTGVAADIVPGSTKYFRKKASSSGYYSGIQTLTAEARPAAPSFAVDFSTESTATAVSAEYEYADNADMIAAIAGTDNVVALLPGTTKYFRKKSTASQFASAIQTLAVPSRSDGPVYTIDYVNIATAENVPSGHEYSVKNDMSEAESGTGSPVALDPGIDMYFRGKSTSGSFLSRISHMVVPEAPVIQTNAPDTLTEVFFLISVDFHEDAPDFDTSGLVIINAKAKLINENMFKITPETAGEVKIKVKANALPGGNFESEAITTYYKPLTSVREIEQGEGSMLVYPSPAKDMLNLEIKGNISLPGLAEMLDIRGSIVHAEEIQSAHSTMDISTLPEGLYMLKFVDDHGKVFTYKLIKR